MIARLLRGLWVAAIVAALAVAWWLAPWVRTHFGPVVGPVGSSVMTGVIAVMAVGALHPAAVAFNFVASRVLGDPVPEALRLSLWQAFRTYDAEIDASLCGVWVANPFLGSRRAPLPAEPVRPVAILFVHGYFCNRAVWHSFMRDAASRGYPCEALTLTDPFASIDTQAELVDAAIAALSSEGDRQVVLVGHSMGGLVARAALQRIAPSRVAHVITLGSPHHGAFAARFGRHASIAQMRENSPWLAELARREQDGAGLPRTAYTSIYSVHDDIVFPQRSAVLEGATTLAIGGCGHVALLYDKRVRTIVFDRLAELRQAGVS